MGRGESVSQSVESSLGMSDVDARSGEEREDAEGTTAASNAVDGSVIRCTIEANRSSFEVVEVPEISIRIENVSSEPIVLVRCLDGSSARFRYPYCWFTVTDQDGASAVEEEHDEREGVLSLAPVDLVKIGPGESFDPFQNIGGYGLFSAHQISSDTFSESESYRVQLHYDTRGASTVGFYGSQIAWTLDQNRAELEELIARVPRTSCLSNEIEVVFH